MTKKTRTIVYMPSSASRLVIGLWVPYNRFKKKAWPSSNNLAAHGKREYLVCAKA